MRRDEKLKRSAREMAYWRGHKLGKFKFSPEYGGEWFATCQKKGCTACVLVNTKSLPRTGDYEVMGSAVAVVCPEKK